MTVGFIASHYPEPAHFEGFVTRTLRVGEILRSTPGCVSAECWVTTDGEAVVTMGKFESPDRLAAAFAAVQAAGIATDTAFDERERKPRQILNLTLRA